GAAAVVTKPLSEEVLLEKVRKIFGDKFIREMIPNDHSGAANPFGVNEEEYSEALRPMVEEFLKYFSELVDELSMAVRDRDVESIKRITHDIKGTSGSFGYDDATALAVKLCEAVSPDSSSTVAFADWNKSEDLLLQLRNKVKS
ncbi:MAG: Hpt domain-containing protein, partial [Bacteroidetes bacterium]|nr:Hpt domain-containing protein [Bacteroidota bacterium]